MKKLIFVVFGIAGVGVAYWLISPLFITREVNEGVSDIVETETELEESIRARGTFSGLAGHSGEGTTLLIESGGKFYVRFEEDFRVTNGPDLFVYLGKNGKYAPEARLGTLRGNVGAQNYEIPSDIDPSQYDEVWVWCRAFFVPFASAQLR